MVSTADQLRIISYLKNFGCNSREAIAYMETLNLGSTTVQELARKLKRNRITVYYTVQQLIKKGLLFETRKGKKRTIAAEHADVLKRLIEKHQEELHMMEESLPHIAKIIDSIHPDHHEVTVVKVYSEAEGFKKMLEQSLSAQSEVLVFTNIVLAGILGEKYFENYLHRRAEKGIHTRIIYPPHPFVEKINIKSTEYKIKMKILPQDTRSGSGFYLWDNTVAIQSWHEHQRSCTIIENRDIANFFRNNIFNHFWEVAKTP